MNRDKLNKALRDLCVNAPAVIIGRVIAVNDTSCTLDDDGVSIYNVRLKASVDNKGNRMLIIPALDSYVLAARIMDNDDYAVIMYNEISAIEMSIAGKFKIKNEQVVFKELLNDLIDAVKQAVTQGSAGASTMSPATKQQLTVISNKVDQLFE